MPELPEVETVKSILNTIVPGKTIENIVVLRDKNILGDPKEFTTRLKGETFKKVSRIGKFLIFHLTSDLVIISHLRMEGKYFEGQVGDKPDKHDILIYEFNDGTSLRYNDVRKFGIIKLSTEDKYLKEPPISDVGPEPFALKKEQLYAGLQSKKTPIKDALLDQTLIAGLGNIYDDEVLFATKINPKTPANKITLEQCQTIIDEAIRILNLAIENGGSTIKSYHPKEGVNGEMQNNLLAYGHGNEKCPRCGFPMRKIFIKGRGTVYCPHCQIDPGKPLIIGVTGPIGSGKSTVSKYLKKRGFAVISADAIVSELYDDSEYLSHLKPILGPIYQDGKINREALMDRMLNDAEFRELYEKQIHSKVYEIIDKKIESAKSDKIVLDVPLLVPSPLEEKCDLIITVLADENIRKERIAKRGRDPEKALRLNKSFHKGATIAHSGLIVKANGNEKELFDQLDSFGYF